MEWNWANIWQWVTTWIWANLWPLVTTVIAVYGAVLSTLNTLYNYRRDRIKISIKSDVEKVIATEVDYYLLKLTIINRSHRPVTITEMGFMSTDGERLTFQKSSAERGLDSFCRSFAKELHFDPNESLDITEPPDSELPKKLLISDKVEYNRLTQTVLKHENGSMQSRTLIPYGVDSEGNIYKGRSVMVTRDQTVVSKK